MAGEKDSRNDERVLIARAKGGDERAWDELMDRKQEKLLRLAKSFGWNMDDAEDIAQEVKVRAYTRLHAFHEQCNVITWLYRILGNVCLEWLRKNKTRCDRLDDLGNEQGQEDPGFGQLDSSIHIQHLSRTLPEIHQNVLWLYEIEQLSYEEIAKLLDIRLGTVRSRLHKAREALRMKLASQGINQNNYGDWV